MKQKGDDDDEKRAKYIGVLPVNAIVRCRLWRVYKVFVFS